MKTRTQHFATLVVVIFSALAVGCTKSEAELQADDRAAIASVVEDDVRASRAMKTADDAARKGDVAAAIASIDTKAKPAIAEGLKASSALAPKTPWGKAKRDELAGILRDRESAMPGYVEAIRGEDPEKLLAAIEAQAAIERRAVATVAAVQEGR